MGKLKKGGVEKNKFRPHRLRSDDKKDAFSEKILKEIRANEIPEKAMCKICTYCGGWKHDPMKFFDFFRKTKKKEKPSLFSEFFLHASPERKKEVFMEAARRANKAQREVFERSRSKI